MTVKRILEEKGRNVLTAGPQATLRETAVMMHDNRIGAVIILDQGDRIAGIVAERDVVANIAKFGPSCLDKPVSSVMWTNVYRCTEDMTTDAVMEMMSTYRARHIPVEKDGKLAGIISIGDVVKAHIRDIKSEAEHIKAYIAG